MIPPCIFVFCQKLISKSAYSDIPYILRLEQQEPSFHRTYPYFFSDILVSLDFEHVQYKCIYHKFHTYIVYDFPGNPVDLRVVLFYYYYYNIPCTFQCHAPSGNNYFSLLYPSINKRMIAVLF